MKFLTKIIFILSLVFSVSLASAQNPDTVTTNTSKIYLEHSDLLYFDEERSADMRILIGNVIFRHDSSYMYCDSAYFYDQDNSLEAFSNVRLEQGDTLFVYGNYLHYDGNSQLAKMRENVRMENGELTLFTDSLNYDRLVDVGYYFDGGLIVDEENELSSFYGQYSPETKWAIFNDSVELHNPQFVLYSDTLHYNSETKIAVILGPSVIVSDSATIYSSRGWYDTLNNTSILLDRSEVVSGDRVLIGDSIYYDQEIGYGEAFGNMLLIDTLQKLTLEGEYGYYNEKTEFALATDQARLLEYSQADTLFLHGDTLKMITLDSAYRELKAYYGVRFFRNDLQGVCDSMQFNTRDSVLYMYTDPIVWHENYQLYGDTIHVFLNDSAVDHVHVIQFAFSVEYIEPTYYNQVKGDDMKIYFEGQEIRQTDVSGSVETLYYPIDGEGVMIGMNDLKSSYLSIWFQEQKIEKIKAWPMPKALLTPIPDLSPSQKTLKDFYWFDYIRPKDKDDIFTVVDRKEEDILQRPAGNLFRERDLED